MSTPTPAPDATSDGLIFEIEDRGHAGFVICAASSPKLRVLYADVHARWLFAGRPLVGMPLAALFEESVDEADGLVDAHRCLHNGVSAHLRLRLRTSDRHLRRVGLRLQPLVGGDGNEPWALCSFDAVDRTTDLMDGFEQTADDHTGLAEASAPALDLAAFVEDLAQRLRQLLPGDVEVTTVKAVHPVWVDTPADALEEIVACLLALATPLDPWRYTVRLAVREQTADNRAALCFALAGNLASGVAATPLPAGLEERMDELGLRLLPDTSTGVGQGMALIMSLAMRHAHNGRGGPRTP